jgi:hypothetical protein
MSLKKYLTEAELASIQPVTGDEFDISIRDLTNIETFVIEHTEGSITIALDEKAIQMLEDCGCTFEDDQIDELAPVIGAVGGALARGAGALARGASKAVVGTGLKAAANKLDKKLFGPSSTEGDYEESIEEDSLQVGDIVRINYPTSHENDLGEVVELAPSGNFAYVQFKNDDIQSYDVSNLIKASEQEKDAYYYGEEDYEESINDIRRLSGMPTKEPVKEQNYDTSPGSPYDRGAADAYYGRKSRPHKIAPYTGPDAVKGQMQLLPLTDPAEIAAYEAGYREAEFGEKDYGESAIPEGIENWKMGITSIPRTEPFKLKKIVVTSKYGKTYTFDTEEDAKRHFGSNWDSKINNPKWRAANGWKLDMNNTKSEKGLDESKITKESAELVAQLIIENKLADFLPPFTANGLWVSDRRGNSVLEVTRHGAVAQEVANALNKYVTESINEAEYRGRKVPLGKPMQGDVKKFKVYVKDPKTGNVKKVNFGDPNMRIKKSNPERRKSFRARHNCDNPGPRTKARYWSCRKW